MQGTLTRLESAIINGQAVGAMGVHLELHRFVVTNGVSMVAGGHTASKLLADCTEALFGAVRITCHPFPCAFMSAPLQATGVCLLQFVLSCSCSLSDKITSSAAESCPNAVGQFGSCLLLYSNCCT